MADAFGDGGGRGPRVVAAGLVAVVLAGLLVLVFGPARGARTDIARQKELVATQLATLRSQLELQRQQLALTRRLAEQILAIARATLHHAANIDRKTP